MDRPIEVAVLGPVAWRRDGELVEVAGAPQRSLLARLALARGRVVGPDELIDVLWPDRPPSNAAGNLRSYLSRLRRTVGADLIERGAAGYRLALDPDQLDLGQVERLVAGARQAAGDQPAEAARQLGAALAHWRGEPLAGVADPLPFAPELARLAEWRATLEEEWLTLRLAAGEAGSAVSDLRRIAHAQPLREPPHLLLMRALHASGRTAEALDLATAFRRRLADETGLDPTPALGALVDRLLADDPDLRPSVPAAGGAAPATPAAPAAPTPENPRRRWAPGDSFIGREAELAVLAGVLASPGVVTVVGPGGVGKSRLALEALDRRQEPGPARTAGSAPTARAEYPTTPVHLVELAGIPPGGAVAEAVAGALGLRAAPSGLATAIADALRPGPALLVLDCCEHVLDGARELVAELDRRCDGLTVLATSRRRLEVSGEQVVRLGPLAETDQVALFVDRAGRLRAGFDAADPVVRDVCRLVDGLPLGVELAASREAVFGLAQLRDRLSGGLGVLDGHRAGVMATVEWSYRLLDPDAQQLFDRLAVCRGDFPLEAVDQLAPAGPVDAAALLAALVESSLVAADLSVTPPRYRLLDAMRHVGLRHLTPEQRDAALTAHARWVFALADELDGLRTAMSPLTTRLFGQESVHLRETLSWLAETGRWDEAGQLGAIVAVVSIDTPLLALNRQLRQLGDVPADADPTARGLCALAAANAHCIEGNAAEAQRLGRIAQELVPATHPKCWATHFVDMVNQLFAGDRDGVTAASVAVHTGSGPDWARSTALCCAALAALYHGDLAAAEQWVASDRELLDRVSKEEGFVSFTRGELASGNDPESALDWFVRSRRQATGKGNAYTAVIAGIGRAAVLIRLGRTAAAADACAGLLGDLRGLGMWPQIWTTLRLTAELLVDHGEPAAAVTILAAADADPLAPAVTGPDLDRHAAVLRSAADQLDDRQLTAARAAGETGGRTVAYARARDALAAVHG